MTEIDVLRNRVDEITLQMARLLKDRTDTVRRIGEVKRSIGMRVTDQRREDALRQKVIGLCGTTGMDESIAAKFLNFLVNESVKVQSEKSTHLSVFRRAKALEEQGRDIIHMEVGEPDFMPPEPAGRALAESYSAGRVRYGPAEGMPELRDALARYASERFGARVGRENILVSPGGRFAVFAAITTLLNPGDEIITIEPAWPAYKECALDAGVKVRAVKTTLGDGWSPSLREVRRLANPNTRMIVLNYPNNPTGKILDAATQDGIMSMAEENGLYVLSDEIYSEYAPDDWRSVLSYGYENGIAVQSFSKSHAMTGFRVGFAVADPGTIGRMARLQALCLTSVAEPIQYAALGALGSDVSGNARLVRGRLESVCRRAEGMGLEFARPDGAMYVFARVRDGLDGAELANILLDHGVAIAPGEGFGEYGDFVRISACQDEKKLMEGMDILDGILRR